ncbi:MAG: hypothetical protein U0353_24245 [Sandaracinus sp.]
MSPRSLTTMLLLVFAALSGCPSPSALDAGGDDGGRPSDDAPDAPLADAPDDAPPDAPSPGVLEADTLLLDFGDWTCGSSPPAARDVTITNTGGTSVALSFVVERAPEYFAVEARGLTTLSPGDTTTLRVQPQALAPFTLSHSGDRRAILRVGGLAIELHVRRVGADLFGDGAEYDFGDLDVGATRSGVLSVRNVGNGPAELELEADLGPGFTVDVPGVPGTIAAGAEIVGSLSLAVAHVGATDAAIAIRGMGSVCASNLEAEARTTASAVGATGSLRVPGDVVFDATACGSTPAPVTRSLHNAGSAPLTWSATLVGGASSPFRVTPTTGTLGPGEMVTVTIEAPAIPSTPPTLPYALEDRLVFTSSAPGDTPASIALRAPAMGAWLAWSGSPAFELTAPWGGAATTTIELVNVGDAPATPTITTSFGELTHDLAPGTVLLPDERAFIHVTYTPAGPDSPGFDDVLTATAPGSCRPPANTFTFHARPAREDIVVPVDSLALSASCGGTPAPQLLVLRNQGTTTETLSFGAPSPFFVSVDGVLIGDGTRDLAPGEQMTIEVHASGDPLDPVSVREGDLRIATSDDNRYVHLRLESTGALLSLEPVHVGAVAVGVPASVELPISNHGDRPVVVRAEAESGSYAIVTVPAAVAGEPGTAIAHLATRAVPSDGFSEQVTVTEWSGGTASLCSTTSLRTTVTGVGTLLPIDAPAIVSVGDNPCGGFAPSGEVLVHNNGSSPTTFTAAMAPGSILFRVLTASGTIPAGGTAAIGVSATPVGAIRPGRRAESMLVTTPTATLEVVLQERITGAMIETLPADAFVGSAVVGSASSAAALPVTIVSTYADPIDATSPTPNGFTVGATHNALGEPTLAARFTPASVGDASAVFDLQLRGGVPNCGGAGRITLRGTGLAPTAPAVSIPASIEMSQTFCGDTPAPVTFEIVNRSSTMTLPFSVTPRAESLLTVEPASGMLAPRGRRTITVSSVAIPATYVPTSFEELTRDRGLFARPLDEHLEVVVGTTRAVVPVKMSVLGYAYMPERLPGSTAHSARFVLRSTPLFESPVTRIVVPSYVWRRDVLPPTPPAGCTFTAVPLSPPGGPEFGLSCGAATVVSFAAREASADRPFCSPTTPPLMLMVP